MDKIEKLFDINIVLMTLFSSLETIRKAKKIDLIYDMERTIPRELRGDFTVLLRLLTEILTFIFQYTDKKEILLSLAAPEDFLFEELISFKINETHIGKEKILEFLGKNLSKDLEILDGKIVYDINSDIHLNIPFKINELGYRRHYRLPDVAMMGKKVLLICESKEVAQSIKHMFSYFHYDVEVGCTVFREHGNDLTPYDVLIVEERFNTEEFEHIIARVQQNIPLKYVLLKDAHTVEFNNISVSTHLIKPVTEESIYELIVALFKDDVQHAGVKVQTKMNIVDIKKVLQISKNDLHEEDMGQSTLKVDDLASIVEKHKMLKLTVLDRELGEANTKEMGLVYKSELKKFLDTFDRSDIYFREIVNDKLMHKVKEFCIDLERHAKLIGAQSMLKFADTVSLIFIYDKLDMLPIYPGKYHIELEKLIEEIKKYLDIK